MKISKVGNTKKKKSLISLLVHYILKKSDFFFLLCLISTFIEIEFMSSIKMIKSFCVRFLGGSLKKGSEKK